MEIESSIDIVAKEMMHDIVMKLMTMNGWDPEKNPIEYDAERDDSQYSLFVDEIHKILDVMNAETIQCPECMQHDIFITAHRCPVELDYPQQHNHLGE